MTAQTVGLDIGRTAIKAVRLRRSFIGRETVEFLRQDISRVDQDMGEARQAQLLKQFIQQHRLGGSRLMTALSCGDLMIRTLALPFHDTSKLMQVIPSEVESMIPLPLEEVAIDYELLTQRKRDKKTPDAWDSQVLVAAAQRATLLHHVQQLADAGIEPDAVRVDALALFAVARRMSRQHPEPFTHVAMIDLGARRTTVCLSYEGDPWMLRSIRYGTNQLDHLREGRDQAELDGQTGEPQRRPLTVERMEPGFSTLLRELRSTLHAYEASTRHRLKYAWFTGGGAESSELIALLSRSLDMEPINLAERYRPSCAPAYAVAMGLALMGKSGAVSSSWTGKSFGSAINLKRVMHTTLAQSQAHRRHLWHISLASLCLLLLAIGDLSIQVVLKQTRLQELKAEVRGQFHQRFAGIDLVTDELDQAKAALQDVRRTTALLGVEHAGMLIVFNELIRHIPQGVPVTMQGLLIEQKAIQIDAQTDSFESMEKIRQGLDGFPDARDVSVRDARVGANPNQVLFRILVARGGA